MKQRFVLLVALMLAGYGIPTIAAPPDPDTSRLILQRYSLFLKSGRSCSYFANPKTLEQNRSGGDKNDRFIWALNAGGPNDGSLCRGVFNFLFLNVNCRTKVVTFKDSASSLEEQERNKVEYVDQDIANQVCAIKANGASLLPGNRPTQVAAPRVNPSPRPVISPEK